MYEKKVFCILPTFDVKVIGGCDVEDMFSCC